jgi:hypothetical protein
MKRSSEIFGLAFDLAREHGPARCGSRADTLFSGAEPCVDGMKLSVSGLRAAVSTTALFDHHHPAGRDRDGVEVD